MKKIPSVLASFVILVLGLLMFFNGFTGEDSPTPKPAPSPVEAARKIHDNEQSESVIGGYSSVTRDQFDQLPQEQQDKMLEEFVLDFWERELGPAETDAEENNLSLEIFARPYMHTLTEREYLQLSPEDRERADAEIDENMREIRSYYIDVAAEVESLIADKDYLTAEAYLVNILEMGRELGANKEGLVLTRAQGVGVRRLALRKLVKLYTLTGDNSGVQMATEQLSEEDEKMVEIRAAAKQREANP
ncbi:MAG: hypothetical protein ACYSW8_12180 [Planctomycetota bacterium]|jgi:hypothetical protein